MGGAKYVGKKYNLFKVNGNIQFNFISSLSLSILASKHSGLIEEEFSKSRRI